MLPTLPPWLRLFGVVPLAYLLAMLIIVPDLQPPTEDLVLITLYMGFSGYGTTLTVYALMRVRLLQRLGSLRLLLVVTGLLAVLLIFINVYVTVRLMYISHHDFVLTVALLVFAGLIALVSISIVTQQLIQRMERIGAATHRLARYDFSDPLEVQGNDELGQLERVVNEAQVMLANIEARKRQLDQSRRDLITWVSHDLKTPLAAIRAMNEAMLDGVVTDDETVNRYQHSIQREVEHMAHLIEDLFQLAAVDAGELILKRQATSLAMLIEDILAQIGGQAVQGQVDLQTNIADGLPLLYIAPEKIKRVLYNLLNNALQYTPAQGVVRVCAELADREVVISVYNSGSFIPAHELERVFERFYRGEQARSARGQQRGTGLGLAIARTFTEAHGGSIRASSSAGDGTTFTLRLPLNHTDATPPA